VAIADAQPNLGINNDDPGENIIRDNGRHDVYNATRSNILTAVGNDIDPDKISGDVEFVAREIPQSGFVDVRGHWAEGYITALAELDVIGGFLDGTYRPNDPVTRAQFAAIVNKAFSPDPKRQSIEFVDVDQTFWGYSAIQTAYQGQFLSGYPGQVFRPDERIPRTQVLVSLSSGLELTNGQLAALDKYADAGQIPEWAKDAIAAATQQRIVVNYPDVSRLNPSQNATRADVAAFVYQALVSTGDAEPILSPYLVTYP
ncbi:MAG: S-layer homology domain-containing protein, partial [Cyanobacteria bacterium J06626_14]